jgi:hypothetical protein
LRASLALVGSLTLPRSADLAASPIFSGSDAAPGASAGRPNSLAINATQSLSGSEDLVRAEDWNSAAPPQTEAVDSSGEGATALMPALASVLAVLVLAGVITFFVLTRRKKDSPSRKAIEIDTELCQGEDDTVLFTSLASDWLNPVSDTLLDAAPSSVLDEGDGDV